MWISKGVKSFFQKGWWSRQFFQQGKGFFLQSMLYNAQLGRIEDIYFQREGEQSRKFISTRGEHYSRWGKTTFLRGVETNIFTFPEGLKQ